LNAELAEVAENSLAILLCGLCGLCVLCVPVIFSQALRADNTAIFSDVIV
jgi:hypothetical protein